jgi:hypothetical protein
MTKQRTRPKSFVLSDRVLGAVLGGTDGSSDIVSPRDPPSIVSPRDPASIIAVL